MRTGDIITLTKAQFLKLAPLGLRVIENTDPTTLYAYNPKCPNFYINDYPDYIESYVYYDLDQTLPHCYPINGLWMYFDGQTEFTVIQPPVFRISKIKAL